MTLSPVRRLDWPFTRQTSRASPGSSRLVLPQRRACVWSNGCRCRPSATATHHRHVKIFVVCAPHAVTHPPPTHPASRHAPGSNCTLVRAGSGRAVNRGAGGSAGSNRGQPAAHESRKGGRPFGWRWVWDPPGAGSGPGLLPLPPYPTPRTRQSTNATGRCQALVRCARFSSGRAATDARICPRTPLGRAATPLPVSAPACQPTLRNRYASRKHAQPISGLRRDGPARVGWASAPGEAVPAKDNEGGGRCRGRVARSAPHADPRQVFDLAGGSLVIFHLAGRWPSALVSHFSYSRRAVWTSAVGVQRGRALSSVWLARVAVRLPYEFRACRKKSTPRTAGSCPSQWRPCVVGPRAGSLLWRGGRAAGSPPLWRAAFEG